MSAPKRPAAQQGAPRLADVPVDELHQRLRYDPDTGLVYRREMPPTTGPRPSLDEPVGSTCAKGYKVFEIRGRQYKLHRIAWALHTGVWPELPLDHLNGDRSDNRWANLREVTYAQNRQHCKQVQEGKCYYKRAQNGRYEASFRRANRRVAVGTFATEHEAEIAVQVAKALYL